AARDKALPGGRRCCRDRHDAAASDSDSRQPHQDPVAFDADIVRRDSDFGIAYADSCLDLERPEMPRADNFARDDVAFAKRATAMRTRVFRCEEAARDVIQRDTAVADRTDSCAAGREI